ncbi:uncharacterized protein IUM83_12938 [Phytophthora cinnamomi]|uniref:uncharacterized protein n=1 Tax=Phytophthora cinnamomi TaxID=4785 RepID=UPI0035594644|nr:hypothetical protein IUM83_12938 [Phytophthora cinnamomi]
MPPLPGAETRFSFAITPPPPFASSHSSYSSGLASQTYNSALQWQAESNNAEVDDYDPPTKRWRSTGSSSNSSELERKRKHQSHGSIQCESASDSVSLPAIPEEDAVTWDSSEESSTKPKPQRQP